MSKSTVPPKSISICFLDGIGPESPIGGKASALADLAKHGFPVPAFFVVSGIDSHGDTGEIRRACRALDPSGGRFAVRSSALGEDSASHSFAGQFDSFLRVPLSSVADRCLGVVNSAKNDRVDTYRASNDLVGTEIPISVIVQKMIDADLSGVAFTADPLTGDRGTTLISATAGTAEDLVSGATDGENFRITAGGVISSPSQASTLTKQQAAKVAALARRAESHFGCPQDIEWAITGEDLFLLQARPITTLPPEQTGELRIWDNSNIAESYSGVTSPLTFSFASRAYASVYRQFCYIMGVPKKRVADSAAVFDNMLGHIRGRVFYNLVNWYRVLALLPGFRTNRKFMEQMMGVKEPMPDEIIEEVEKSSSVGRFRDAAHISRTVAGLVINLARHRRAVKRFHRRLDETLTLPDTQLEKMSAAELVSHYHDLEEKLLTRWDTPLVNDFFAMIFFGLLKKKSTEWLGDKDGSIANRLIRDTGAVTNLEPPRLLREMASIASSDDRLLAALESASTAEELETFPDFHKALTAYLAKFGDRCLSELKLESPTLEDDASPLLGTVSALARSGVSESKKSSAIDGDIESAIRSLPFVRRRLFRWILKNARGRLQDRENLRFERTRVFGRVRTIMRHLGHHHVSSGKLGDPHDIFYLTVKEALGETPFDKTTARNRRLEFENLKSLPPPPDRFETRGDSLDPPLIQNHLISKNPPSSLTGVGASPGIVRGIARVITDPRTAHLSPGEILVAQQTDPGWVVLFPAAAGVVVERGSLLSHSAIVAREMGIPAVVSLTGATSLIPDGAPITVDGTTGSVTLEEFKS